MRFLIDTNLPPALATWLTGQGHEATHTITIGLGNAPDRKIWEVAASSNLIIVTKDEDFTFLKASNSDGPAVIWVRIGNTVRRVLLQRLASAWPLVVEKLQEGHGVIEVR